MFFWVYSFSPRRQNGGGNEVKYIAFKSRGGGLDPDHNEFSTRSNYTSPSTLAIPEVFIAFLTVTRWYNDKYKKVQRSNDGNCHQPESGQHAGLVDVAPQSEIKECWEGFRNGGIRTDTILQQLV
ncbi:hypothetical protein EVAR_67368_1 [Eumeta japonica]|uniref:Uncharacterized protein n=1 Tax=Eumeta variegata TaxID=151549 RepID=A0A4C1ZP39_EUMVA|nr:hypothetical protein EVAR_67368_1 [Eumeta japonica]